MIIIKIGLLDVDRHNFPNLPLMKLSAYHKAKGDNVHMWSDSNTYDRVYISKVFTESSDPTVNNAHEIIRGGSGYDLTNKLPPEIEHICPDYNLYPQYDFALGFLTRGCPRLNHTFCITPKKDGCKSVRVANITEFWQEQKNIVLLDQNLLACPDRMDILKELAETKATVVFNGGLDVRYLNEDIINALKRVKIKRLHLAWDDPREDLYSKFKLLAESRIISSNDITVYVLTNYWSTHEQDLERIYKLRELGLLPYVMIYDKQKYVNDNGRWLSDVKDRFTHSELMHFKNCQLMQRWCNSRSIIKLVPDFRNYENYKNWIKKGNPVPVG